MKLKGILVATLVAITCTGLAAPSWAASVGNSDYSGIPPFLPSTFATGTPNILIVLDNGARMSYRAHCTKLNADVPYTDCPAFDETATYVGIFDSMGCYTYYPAADNTRFIKSTSKALISTACSNTEWDGNLLNWVTFRRIDAIKKAMIGGSCAVGRNPDGTCPPSGNPSLITMKGQDYWPNDNVDDDGTNVSTSPMPTGSGAGKADGRVPTVVQKGGLAAPPANLVFHVHGMGPLLAGTFCVADAVDPQPGISSCQRIPGGFTEQQFTIHVAVDQEPTDGIIQQLGGQARFGLIVSKGNSGALVLVPIGNPQYAPWRGNGDTRTFRNNQRAMMEVFEDAWTGKHSPMTDLLFESMRYFAQVNAYNFPNSYNYPLAFSPGANFNTGGRGSPFPGKELSALLAGETCPTAAPSDPAVLLPYIANACGRDPFYYGNYVAPGGADDGSDVYQPWAPPTVVTCCKSFILLITDGTNVAGDAATYHQFEDYAHAIHGRHCTSATNPPCPTDENTPIADLLRMHKDDPGGGVLGHGLDDVAYWGHTNDLRDTTIKIRNHMTGAVDILNLETAGDAARNLPGFQNVTVYVLHAFGNINAREMLMHTAIAGGFEDKDKPSDLGKYMVPDKVEEWDSVNNDTGVAIPDGIPDTYFESKTPDDLRDKLGAAFRSMLQKTASGTSVSVLATSTTGEGAVYQAYFLPSTYDTISNLTTQVTWTGFLQGLFLDTYGNLREDTDGDGKLVLKNDNIVKIRFDEATKELYVDLYRDADGDGKADDLNGDGVIQDGFLVAGVVDNRDAIKVNLKMKDIKPIWEAGRQLAFTNPGTNCDKDGASVSWPNSGMLSNSGITCRRILTWVDLNNDGKVDPTERIEFSLDSRVTLCPFLGSVKTSDGAGHNPNGANCRSANASDKTAALNEADNIIKFIRGERVTGLRTRDLNVLDGGVSTVKVWKLGDIMHSTPVSVGGPRERFDILYGDTDYAKFFQRYKDRRQVVYVGANDGMLHAFNAGFLSNGDDADTATVTEQLRFTTTPKKPGTSTDCGKLPCDAKVAQYTYRSSAPKLGAELWAFIPQDLLPNLQWLTMPSYDHVYYVDLKPKVADVRIFDPSDPDHPGGWGTVLIGGFRLGGSCSRCKDGKGTPRVVTADFDGSGATSRIFLSSYFVLDITNLEKDPKLLWTFRDTDLGLTTSTPAVVRVNQAGDAKTSSANEKWYVVFGTGPTHFAGIACKSPTCSQKGRIFAVDLKQGPKYKLVNDTNAFDQDRNGTACSTSAPCLTVSNDRGDRTQLFNTGQNGAFMGDATTLDFDLDFRVDAIYIGSTVCNGDIATSSCNGSAPKWKGAMWRITTNGGDPDPYNWGVSAAPTKLISTFAYTSAQASTCVSGSPCAVGPIVAAPALSIDDTSNLWVFFGTGRFFSSDDKLDADLRHFFGVKDCVVTGACSDPTQSTQRNNLYNVSSVTICSSCSPDANVSTDGGATYSGGFDAGSSNLVASVQNGDGWFTTLPNERERSLSSPTLLGGTLFFTTFIPVPDLCGAEGNGLLYSVYYLTGTPYKESSIGTEESGSNTVVTKSVSMGEGVPSQIAVQIGKQGTGALGTSSSEGSVGGLTLFTQSSTGVLGQLTGKAALQPWSRILSWRDV